VWHPAQKTRWLDDGGYEMQLPFVNETELVMDVLRHGGQVRVMGPDALRAAVTEQLRAGLVTNGANSVRL
jgi:predicted DNA-binding transcriptional regulator YafY